MANVNSFRSSVNTMEQYIYINGVRMNYAEYKKQLKAKEKAKKDEKKAKQAQALIRQLPPYIDSMIKHIKVLKSLAAYYDNGYRQWGAIARDIINNPFIKSSFLKYRMRTREMNAILEDIRKIGGKNEKNVFQYIEKLSYKIDDMRTEIYSLTRGVNDSRVCEFHKDKECINGNGRRLGLQVLMFKALHSMSKIDELIKELNQIASDGLDAMDYNYQNGRYSNGIQF